MESNIEKDSIEILTKEDERFCLQKIGFFQDIRKEALLISHRFPPAEGETYGEWKHRCLKEYYRLRGFSIFCRENIDNPEFETTVKSLIRRHADRMFETYGRTEVDNHLAPDSDTVSFALSQTVFQEIYTLSFSALPPFGNTSELENYSRNLAESNFPVEESRIIGYLRDNDNFYWGKFYKKLKPITAAFCYQMSGISGNNNTHDIWSETCISVNRAVVEHRLKEPVDSKAVLSYSIGVLKNKNKEIARSKARTPVDVDSISYRLQQDGAEDKYFDRPETVPENFPSQIDRLSTYIDYSDKESVQGYFIVILYNKEHPLHEPLVKGFEDKVGRLFEHYVDGLSYEEIIVRHYGVMSPKESAKECARLRQEMKRLKKNLLDRFRKIMEQYK